MVHDGDQYVLIGTDSEQAGSQRDLFRERECVPCGCRDRVGQRSFGPGRGVDDVPAEVRDVRIQNMLVGYAVGGHQQCSQALVAGHDVTEGGAQRFDVEVAGEP
ncbi:hypothetical protein MOBUDSM44075_04212 [Mycolicibacterium obuense]|uniref:Uncharacterized protein n=1 Tax=Mycolicibacterium obuense TaxID=1807 RepID=A0A0J6VK41_9MYCO|nr:hypothetical protein MOBUDSM44075_04212 [Mycolicibacterium obuense]